MTRHGTVLESSREQDTALGERSEPFLFSVIIAQKVEELGQQLVAAFDCIRRLNESARAQNAEIHELRTQLGQVREGVGLEPMKDRLISRAAAARKLGVSSRTLQRWEKTKPLHPRFSSRNRASYLLAEVNQLQDSFGSAGSGPAFAGK